MNANSPSLHGHVPGAGPESRAGAVSAKMAQHPGVMIRHCHGIAEFEECIRIEREVWQSADIDVVPLPLFVIASETGGQVLGAFEAKRLVGFTLAICGWRNRKPFLHSHMTAVCADKRDQGVGRQLKLFQREDALARGITLVEWTFDPLIIKNAHFNFMGLGAIARRYLPNVYGITTSPLHGALPTDRLVAEWHLRSPRVCGLLGAKPVRARENVGTTTKNSVRISVPPDFEEIRRDDPDTARKIQSQIRGAFLKQFKKGYAATAIVPGESGMDYILKSGNPQ